MTKSKVAGAVSGTAFSMSGFLVAHLGHTTIIHAAAWLPLIIWSLEELRISPRRGWVAALAVGIGMSALAGHPQIFLYAIALGGLYALVRGVMAPSGWLRFYALALLAAAIGVGMSAILLLPANELSGEGARASLTFDEFIRFDLAWNELPRLVFPYVLGGAGAGDLFTHHQFGDPESNHAESTGFVGLIPLVLAFAGLGLRWRSAVTWFWTAIGALAILIALGDSTSTAEVLFDVPVFNLFRAPARFLVVFCFALSVLAGLGAAALLQARPSARFLAVSCSAVVVVAVLGGAIAVLSSSFDTFDEWAATRAGVDDFSTVPWENEAIGVPIVALVTGLAIGLVWIARPRPWTSALLLIVLALDLAVFGWFSDWRSSPKESLLQPSPALATYQEDAVRNQQRIMPLLGITQPGFGEPNLSTLSDLPNASGYSPLAVQRYNELLRMDNSGRIYSATLEPRDQTLDLLAVGMLLIPRDSRYNLEYQKLAADPDRWHPLDSTPRGLVFENRRALPAAWLAPKVSVLSDEEILYAAHEGELPNESPWDPRTIALLEEDIGFKQQPAGGAWETSRVEKTNTTMEIEVRSSNGGLLVVSEPHYPGWQATVDGEIKKIHRTNYALRGVVVPPGEHVVRFEYRPESFDDGLSITLVSLGALALVLTLPPLARLAAVPVRARLRRDTTSDEPPTKSDT